MNTQDYLRLKNQFEICIQDINAVKARVESIEKNQQLETDPTDILKRMRLIEHELGLIRGKIEDIKKCKK